ncbi:MAG: SRPBCC family protein, partial [Phycisphaerales bacterium]
MTKIERQIEIKAPVEDVFNYTQDWRNYALFYAGIYEWRPATERVTGKGARFAYKAKALGKEFEVETEVIDEVVNSSRSFASVTGARTRGQWLFEPSPGGTKVTYRAEYELP